MESNPVRLDPIVAELLVCAILGLLWSPLVYVIQGSIYVSLAAADFP